MRPVDSVRPPGGLTPTGPATGLRVRDLSVRFGSTAAVADVDLDVGAGGIVALLGASGSGKSSLLRGIAGLEPPTHGTVFWDGVDLSATPVHQRGFGVMFQDGQLFPHRDVGGNIAYGIAHLPAAQRAMRVRELLALVGLPAYERRAITSLSGGQAQRVALARSLAPAPRLLLLDEPLSALDRELRERLAVLLRDTLRATGTTALYVTHDQDEAFTVADRIAVLAAGRLVRVDTPEELWRDPGTREVAAFLGYGPFLEASVASALGWPPPGIPQDALVAIGPGGLVVDLAGPLVPVGGQTPRRGVVEVSVTLPGGHPAVLSATERVPDAVLPVRLEPARCAVVAAAAPTSSDPGAGSEQTARPAAGAGWRT